MTAVYADRCGMFALTQETVQRGGAVFAGEKGDMNTLKLNITGGNTILIYPI